MTTQIGSRWKLSLLRFWSWWHHWPRVYCARYGHAYQRGAAFNGEYEQRWWRCHRCGEGGVNV